MLIGSPSATRPFRKLQDYPRWIKRLMLMGADIVIIPLALWSSFALRLGELNPNIQSIWWIFLAAILISVPVFMKRGLYYAVIRFVGTHTIIEIVKGVTIATLALATIVLLSGVGGIPRSVFIIYWGVAILFVSGSRLCLRLYFNGVSNEKHEQHYTAIYGAGFAGVQLATALEKSKQAKVVAILDDDSSFHGSLINGIKVYKPSSLEGLIKELGISQVLLALPTLTRSRRNALINSLEPLPVYIRTIPTMGDLVSGKAQVEDIREVDIEDLLGRDPIDPIDELLDKNIREKSVMVTGAGGSIGSELCRQIIVHRPSVLVLFDMSEFALYKIEKWIKGFLEKNNISVELVTVLGSVQDKEHLRLVMKSYSVQTLYHTAAYKHVPMVEQNVSEGIQNNIFGTLCTVEAAISSGVEAFILISTDKAVRPTSVMGASKRFAELILQGFAQDYQGTRFSIVRFGNVLDSSGSVIPLFKEQIKKGGPVTITHPDIIRYFMTIPEAAQLVIQAGSMGEHGDVFVLDMGEPVKILELAKKMIHLMGLEIKDEQHPEGDIEITFTGLRAGEKLYEELVIGDNVDKTVHPLILKADETHVPLLVIREYLKQLELACREYNCSKVRGILKKVVKEYQPGAIEKARPDNNKSNLVALDYGQDVQDVKTASS